MNVKVDREERPDVDAIYMEATQAMTGSGGWPMTVFMTADGEPFFCGTYFGRAARGGAAQLHPADSRPSHDAWANRRDDLLEQAARLVASVRRNPSAPDGTALPDVGDPRRGDHDHARGARQHAGAASGRRRSSPRR